MGTPELFHMILLCLDQRSLLTRAQRVNKYWHSTIQTTPAIRRALFFQSFPASYDGPPVFNPLLAEVFSAWFPSDETQGNVLVKHDSFELLLPTEKDHRAIRRSRASWTRMLVRQPPIRTLCYWHTESTQARTTLHTITKRRCRRGLRMGELYDLAMNTPLVVYWEGQMEKVAAGYSFEEKTRARLNLIASAADLTVKTHSGATCIKPRPPNRMKVKFGREDQSIRRRSMATMFQI
jgi:hypothetical protein